MPKETPKYIHIKYQPHPGQGINEPKIVNDAYKRGYEPLGHPIFSQTCMHLAMVKPDEPPPPQADFTREEIASFLKAAYTTATRFREEGRSKPTHDLSFARATGMQLAIERLAMALNFKDEDIGA